MAIAGDILLNVILGGQPNETLSSRAWRSRHHKYWWWLHKAINHVFFWQENHCFEAYLNGMERINRPPELKHLVS